MFWYRVWVLRGATTKNHRIQQNLSAENENRVVTWCAHQIDGYFLTHLGFRRGFSQYTARQHGSLVPKDKQKETKEMDQYIVIVYVPKLIIIK